MIRKLAVTLFVLSLIFVKPALAEGQTCVQVYGGGVVCGASTPPHQPVPTGLGENLAVAGGAFIIASGILLYFAKRAKKSFAR